MIHNKIYKQYYPITSEKEKNYLLETNWEQLYEAARSFSYLIEAEYIQRELKYINKIKPSLSLTGHPKYKNIIHNKHIVQTMEMDMTLNNMKEETHKLESIAYRLECKKYNEVSIDELNTILCYMDTETHKTRIFLFLLSILVAGIIWFSQNG